MLKRATLSSLLVLLVAGAVGTVHALPVDARILVWASDAPSPAEIGATQTGQIALLGPDGALEPLLGVPPQTTIVEPCGERATSPNNQYFSFYMGRGDQGDILLMDGQNVPVSLRADATDPLLRSVCLGAGTFRYSPDSSKLGYIAFEPGSGTDDFADGFFKVYDIASGTYLFERESVTAFDISDGQAAFLNFFTNDQGESDEIAVQIWDEERNTDAELATLIPDQPVNEEDRTRCKFESGSVHLLPESRMSVIVGQSCFGGGDPNTSWILYLIDYSSGSEVTRMAEGRVLDGTTGGYQAFARTNVQYLSPNGQNLVVTVPDTITGNSVELLHVPLADPANPLQILDRQGVMPANTRPANSTPALSLDRRWLAIVKTTPSPASESNQLFIYDMNDLSLAPIAYNAGSPGDVIQALAFTADSSQLFAVIGGDDGTENRITSVSLADGSNFNVERGRFDRSLVVSPDGTEIVIGNTIVLEDPEQPNYLNTSNIIIDPPFSTVETLYEGAVVVDGEVEDQSFALPLSWR
jgi:WD40 repeat protein